MPERPTRLKRPWPDPSAAISPFKGRLPQVAADWDTPTRQATVGLGVNPNALNGETFTVDDGGPNEKVYTLQTVLTNVDGNIQIAATRELTHDNIIAAINLDPAGSGTQYAAAMTAQGDIFATINPSGSLFTLLVVAIERGIVPNSIDLVDTMPTGWGGSNLDFGMDGVEAFVPIIQWGGIRIRVQQTGDFGELKAQFVRPAREKAPLGQPAPAFDPQADDKAFFYTLGQPAIDATFLGNGTEVSVEITASEHQGENWLKVSVSTRRPDLAVLDFCDINGVLVGL